MVITALDHVRQCSTYSDGQIIYNLLLPPIKRGEDVTLSFNGVTALPSAFVNSAIVRLVEEVPVEQIKAHLRLVDSTRQINELIRDRFAFVEAKLAN
jgi:STAS-like domain of unknown function (DUF4325)